MSPEQALGRPDRPPLRHLLGGHRALRDADRADALSRGGSAQAPRHGAQGGHRAADARCARASRRSSRRIVMHALAEGSPSDRYQSARRLRDRPRAVPPRVLAGVHRGEGRAADQEACSAIRCRSSADDPEHRGPRRTERRRFTLDTDGSRRTTRDEIQRREQRDLPRRRAEASRKLAKPRSRLNRRQPPRSAPRANPRRDAGTDAARDRRCRRSGPRRPAPHPRATSGAPIGRSPRTISRAAAEARSAAARNARDEADAAPSSASRAPRAATSEPREVDAGAAAGRSRAAMRWTTPPTISTTSASAR